MFAANVMMVSISLGMEQTLVYLYMQSVLKVPNAILGLSTMINCSVEATVFLCYGKIAQLVGGYDSAFKLGIFLNCCAVFGYSNVHRFSDPTIPFLTIQILIGIVFALYWSSAVYIAAELAIVGWETSAQGILNAIGWGLGASIGDLVGGIGMDTIGAPAIFFRVASSQICTLILPEILWTIAKKSLRWNNQDYTRIQSNP